jgi:hypothetical protein
MRGQLKSTHVTATNGKNGDRPTLARTETFTELSTTKMTSIVCTPYRTVEILETADGMFALRETRLTWSGEHSGCAHIWLKPFEVGALREALQRLAIIEAGSAA